MATSPISIEQYLRTTYRPDAEFLDEHLEEKSGGTWDHGRLQGMVGSWFLEHRREWHVQAAFSVRTWVAPTRVRLPDVVVDWAGTHPPVLTEPPLLAIEVLLPTDSYSALQKRFADYRAMGIANVWLIDLETRTARSCEGPAWIERERLEIAGTPIYLDVTALFRALDAGEPL